MSATPEHDELLRDDPVVPLDLRRAFAAYGDISPGREARDALLLRIEQAASDTPGVAAKSRRGLYLAGLTVLGLLLGLGWLGQSRDRAEPAPASGPAVSSRVQAPVSQVDAIAPAAKSVPVPSTVPTTRRDPARAPDVTAPSLAKAPRAARKAVVTRPAPTVTASAAIDPREELSLLTRAKRVLASDAGAALTLTSEHAARFPRGVFTEEREVIAIEALMRSGDHAEATKRAARFRASYPRSTHLDRLRVVLSEP